MKKPICTIVGMGPGVSYAVAKRFAREGFAIAMIARNAAKLDNYRQQMQAAGFEAYGFPADAADFTQLASAFRHLKSQLGNIEVLVYNVSIFREAAPTQLNPDVLVEDFKADAAGLLVAVQQVVDTMRSRKQGTILITGGGQALQPYYLLSSLAAGKAALRALSYCLHDELRSYGIRVATITINGQVSPGGRFDPDRISETYWELYTAGSESFKKEIIYQ
ncbi:MAG: short-chain dehydrogenase [Chitinophagales bacterium]|nr:MAG: short-chain dehydrogenase [Chitinophagales bacterium]